MKKIVSKARIKSPEPIVDVEISNSLLNPKTGQWDYLKAKLCVVGFLDEDTITQVSLRNENEEKFKAEIKEALETFCAKHPCLYAFNRQMEYNSFGGYLGKFYPITEIRSVKGKGTTKDNLFNLLVENEVIPKQELDLVDLNDPLAGNHKEIPAIYEKGRFEEIEKANRICLLKEFFIKKHSGWFLSHFKIDKNNWIIQ